MRIKAFAASFMAVFLLISDCHVSAEESQSTEETAVYSDEDNASDIETELSLQEEEISEDISDKIFEENGPVLAEQTDFGESAAEDDEDAEPDDSLQEEIISEESLLPETEELPDAYTEETDSESSSEKQKVEAEIQTEEIQVESVPEEKQEEPAETDEESSDEEIRVVVDLSDRIIQAGAFFSPDEEGTDTEEFEYESSVFEANIHNVYDALLLAVRNHETVVEVIDFRIPETKATTVYTNFVNSNPQLFYISYSCTYWYNSAGYVVKYELTYDSRFTQENINAFNARADWFISGLEPDWNDEQKALYLHDKIVTECEYEILGSDGKNHHSDAYNVLVDGDAVCQGYALAYKYLLAQAGIYSEVITSEQLNHAWNAVSINGSMYYVDCTWDDPLSSGSRIYKMYCGHENFLKSAGEMYYNTGHDALDWLDQEGNYVINTVGQNTYPYSYWNECTSPIPHVGNLWAYMNRNSTNVYVHNYFTGSDRVLTSSLSGVWHPLNSETSYYTTSYMSLDAYQERFLVSQEDCVYWVSTSGSTSLLGSISSYQRTRGGIYGIEVSYGNTGSSN